MQDALFFIQEPVNIGRGSMFLIIPALRASYVLTLGWGEFPFF